MAEPYTIPGQVTKIPSLPGPQAGAETLFSMLEDRRKGEQRLEEEQAKSHLEIKMGLVKDQIQLAKDAQAASALHEFMGLQSPDPVTGARPSPQEAFTRMGPGNPNTRLIYPLVVEAEKQRVAGEREIATTREKGKLEIGQLQEKDVLARQSHQAIGQAMAQWARGKAAGFDPAEYPDLARMWESYAAMVETGEYDPKMAEEQLKQIGAYELNALQLSKILGKKPGEVLGGAGVRRTTRFGPEGLSITETPFAPHSMDEWVAEASGGKYRNFADAPEDVIREAGKLKRQAEAKLAGQKAGEIIKAEQQKPLSPEEAGTAGVPIGTTRAGAAGAQSLTGTQRTRMDALNMVVSHLDNLEQKIVAAGPQPRTWQERLKETPGRALDVYLQRNPKLAALHDYISGTLAPSVRALGDVGALNEQDIQRARKLMPVLAPLPDTEDVIRTKIIQLRDLMRRGTETIGARPSPEAPKSESLTPFQRWKMKQGMTP